MNINDITIINKIELNPELLLLKNRDEIAKVLGISAHRLTYTLRRNNLTLSDMRDSYRLFYLNTIDKFDREQVMRDLYIQNEKQLSNIIWGLFNVTLSQYIKLKST